MGRYGGQLKDVRPDDLAAAALKAVCERAGLDPADVADVIYLLCTDEARWINGTIVRVDGGEHISG